MSKSDPASAWQAKRNVSSPRVTLSMVREARRSVIALLRSKS